MKGKDSHFPILRFSLKSTYLIDNKFVNYGSDLVDIDTLHAFCKT